MNFKIIYKLDGAGIIYDPNEPLHIDSLLAWTLAPIHCKNTNITRNDIPETIPLPLKKYTFKDGLWCWQASALFPDGKITESMQHWRKKFRQNRIELTNGSPNLMSGTYREYNNPMPLINCLTMTGYASGNRKEVKKLLGKIKYLGKKRAYGKGRVVDIECEEIEENHSLVKNEKAMRWLPVNDENARNARKVRLIPPYWNINGAVNCCEIGDDYKIS